MAEYPYVRVDFEHRVLSVLLNDAQVVATRRLDDAHLVDVDADGHAVGIEILAPDDLKIDEMAERFGFSDQAAVIHAAVQRVLNPTTGTSVSLGPPMLVRGKLTIHSEPESESESESKPPIWVLP